MPLYFAYGSNMSPLQMRDRCPGARPVGPALLEDWRFAIGKRGGANIVPAREQRVWGVLWRCQLHHFAILDGFEGVSVGSYHRTRTSVRLENGRHVSAITYISMHRSEGPARVNYMMTAILPGARAFCLPDDYVEELESWLPDRPIGERRRRYRGRRR